MPHRAIAWTGALLWVAGLGVLLTQCASEPPRPERPSLLENVSVGTAYRRPASWRYHPSSEATLRVRVGLPDGRELLAGQRGERWLVDPKAGRAHAAARLAPEDLIAIQVVEGGGFRFVGRSGTSYEAREPLGPFLRSTAPLDPLVAVSASPSAIVAVRNDGVLVRGADGGAVWARVGPKDVRFADVALDESGRGLALAVPEALYESADHGATWSKLALPPQGALDIVEDETEGIVLETALGAKVWGTSAPDPFIRLPRSVKPKRIALSASIPLGPSAAAVAEGRAVITGRRYMEIRKAKSTGKWDVLLGRVDGSLRSRPLPEADGCRRLALGAFDAIHYLACMRQSSARTTQPVEIRRSDDGGKSWKVEPYSVEARFDDFMMAVGRDGALLLSGMCPPNAAGQGCRGLGVHHRRIGDADGGKAPELAPSATPALAGTALALAFSVDGTRAVALGRRSKSRSLAVYVSHDGGRAFEAHDVEQLVTTDTGNDFAPARSEALRVESATVAEDGSAAFVIRRYQSRTLLVTDEDGRIVSLSEPPTKKAVVGAVGLRALAIDIGERRVWESLDGGSHWEPVGSLPLDPCNDARNCQPALQCHLSGCLVDDELSRVGWGGQDDESTGVLAPPSGASSRFQSTRVRTPLVCSFGPDDWTTLPTQVRLPAADQAAIGDVAWFAPYHEEADASVSVLHATGGRSPQVRSVPLLRPVKSPDEHAYVLSMQVEGVAALRYRLPAKAGDVGLRSVEVAWDNRLEDRVTRAVLPSGGDYVVGDSTARRGIGHHADPDLLSIGSGGIYLRLHRSAAHRQPTHYLDGRTIVTLPEVPWPSAALERTRGEMAKIGSEHVALRVATDSVVRARRKDGQWTFDAMAIGWHDPARFGYAQDIDIAYTSGRSGIHVTVSAQRGSDALSWLFPFRAEGDAVDAPVEVPTQLSLGQTVRKCSTYQREKTARTVAPYQAGTRHPVIVVDASEPMRIMVTGAAVLYGEPKAPCVAAFDASPAVNETGAQKTIERAILLPDDLENGWLFRSEANADPAYRRMSCRFDPSAEIPPEVFRAKGTVVH